jgi:hypothetical protein
VSPRLPHRLDERLRVFAEAFLEQLELLAWAACRRLCTASLNLGGLLDQRQRGADRGVLRPSPICTSAVPPTRWPVWAMFSTN